MFTAINKIATGAIMIIAGVCVAATSVGADEIKRNQEGKFFFRSIEVPAGAETLYVSGHVPSVINKDAPKGSVEMFGDTEAQTISVFNSIKKTLTAAGWSMGDIVMARVYLSADPGKGKMDFGGFSKGFAKFFGTEEQPSKPVRAVVEISDLARPGWLVEIEVRAAKMPK